MKKITFLFFLLPGIILAQNEYIGLTYMNFTYGRMGTSMKNYFMINSPSNPNIYKPYEDASDGLYQPLFSIERLDKHFYLYTDPAYTWAATTLLFSLTYVTITDNELPSEKISIGSIPFDIARFGFGGWINDFGIYAGAQYSYILLNTSNTYLKKYKEEQNLPANTSIINKSIGGHHYGFGLHNFYNYEKFLFQYSFMYNLVGKRIEGSKSIGIQNIINVKYGKPGFGYTGTIRWDHIRTNLNPEAGNESNNIVGIDKLVGNNLGIFVGIFVGL
jgi:hypothetical protein